MRDRRLNHLLLTAACGVLTPAVTSPAAATVYTSSVYASGLNNPRGLAFGPDGALYIAEGGTFSAGGPTTPVEGGAGTFGTTGRITRVAGGAQSLFVTGLPSLTNPMGSATGPQDIAFYNGVGYVIVGLGAHPDVRGTDLGTAPAALGLGSLYSFTLGATPIVTKVADLAAYEKTQNPTKDQVDSNPYHLTSGKDGLYVVDAGGDDLLKVTPTGDISTVTTFPHPVGPDSVPTGVSVGPDGAFYVAELTGFPFVPKTANIFRVAPSLADPAVFDQSIYATGLTNLTDLTWGSDGFLYALQFADGGILSGTPGSIQRINADGSLTLIYGGLIAPTGLKMGDDGAFYVTQFSASSGIGQVLRVSAVVPEPATWASMILGFGAIGGVLRRRRRGAAGRAPDSPMAPMFRSPR